MAPGTAEIKDLGESPSLVSGRRGALFVESLDISGMYPRDCKRGSGGRL